MLNPWKDRIKGRLLYLYRRCGRIQCHIIAFMDNIVSEGGCFLHLILKRSFGSASNESLQINTSELFQDGCQQIQCLCVQLQVSSRLRLGLRYGPDQKLSDGGEPEQHFPIE
jgi:hypothetical protein